MGGWVRLSCRFVNALLASQCVVLRIVLLCVRYFDDY